MNNPAVVALLLIVATILFLVIVFYSYIKTCYVFPKFKIIQTLDGYYVLYKTHKFIWWRYLQEYYYDTSSNKRFNTAEEAFNCFHNRILVGRIKKLNQFKKVIVSAQLVQVDGRFQIILNSEESP